MTTNELIFAALDCRVSEDLTFTVCVLRCLKLISLKYSRKWTYWLQIIQLFIINQFETCFLLYINSIRHYWIFFQSCYCQPYYLLNLSTWPHCWLLTGESKVNNGYFQHNVKTGSSETTNNSCVDLAIWNKKKGLSPK